MATYSSTNASKDTLLQQILNTTQTMIFWKDKERRFVGVNQAFLDYYGFPSEKVLLGKTDEEMGWHSDPDPFQNDEWQVLHQGTSTHLVHGKCLAKGEERDILASKSPLYEQGQIVGLVGSFIDVTEEYRQRADLERLNRKLDGIPGGIALYKRSFNDLKCVSCNQCLAEMLGTTPQALVGKTLQQILKIYMEPEEETRFRKECPILSQKLRQAEGTFQFRNLTKNRPIWLHCSCKMVRETNDEEILYCAYANVNKLIHYEEALQETRLLAEKRYAHALSMLREGKEQNIVAKGHYNFTQNKILEYTSYVQNVYHVDATSSYDEAFTGMMQLSYLASDRQALLQTLSRQQVLSAYEQGDTHLLVSYRRMLNNAEPMWISLAMQTFADPKSGDIEGFSYAYDITENMLRKSIVDNLDGLGYDEIGFVYKASGFWRCYQYHNNQRRTSLLPRSKGSWAQEVNRYAQEEVVKEEQEHVKNSLGLPVILEHLASQPVYTLTHSLRLPNGILRQKQIQFFYLSAAKETIFYSMSDITEQFTRENAQIEALASARMAADQANQSKSNFLSNMSHDLRTPLNGVLGFADLALKEKDLSKKQDYLEKIKSSGKLLEDLVNDTLELSRIESGKLVLRPEVVDGKEFWDTLITALIPAATMHGIKLETNAALYPTELIKVDQLQVKKVLLNLISNAIKYTPMGGTVRVSVQALTNEASGYTRRLIVEDTGIGMHEDFIARMYEPFSQEQRAEAKNVIGTGLGLAIVKRIVDLMGGNIQVQSKLHQGTRFIVDLPIEHWPKLPQDIQKQQAEAKRRTQAALALLENKQVLLCEDNYLNAEIATLLLKDKKMAVDWVKDGALGVAKFSASAPNYYHLILMDVRMPNMDGYAATKAIRSLERQDAKTIPIIAMSANAFEEDKIQAEECGMNDYVVKPIDPTRLYQTLSKHLQ